jgi:hypothetical protein
MPVAWPAKRSANRGHHPRAPSLSQTTRGACRMPWRTASSPRRAWRASLPPKTATSRRGASRVTPWPVRVRCWPTRASTPPVTSHQGVLPLGWPPAGRHGTLTPSAPLTQGTGVNASARGSSGGRCPVATAWKASWRVAIAWPPARCPPPSRSGADSGPAVPAQHLGRRSTRDTHGPRTAQGLACAAAPLVRLHPQRPIQGRPKRAVASVRTPSDPASPPERAKTAGDLARGHALPPQRCPTGRPGGPACRGLGPRGEHRFDERSGPRARPWPDGQEPCRERVGLCHCVAQPLPRRIIVAYAVVEASHRDLASFGNLGEGVQKPTGFSLLCQPSPD